MIRQGRLIAVMRAFLIGCAVLVLAVGCSGTRSEAPKEKEKGRTEATKEQGNTEATTNEQERTEATTNEQTRSPEATTSEVDQEKAQLDQKLQLKPPPEYHFSAESESSAYSCEPEELGYPLPSGCFNFVLTEATGAKLASITEDILTNPGLMRCCDYGLVQRVGFYHEDRYNNPLATIYCFKSKSVAVSALRGALKDAELLGKTENCYIALYRGDAERLKPWH